jgi:hypothetical protein
MKISASLRTACVVGVVMLAASGCTSNSADGQASPPSTSVTASASVIDPSSALPSSSDSNPTPSVAEPSTPIATSSDPAAPQAADRAAIEAQWAAFWRVYAEIVRTPGQDRAAALDSVSVDPLKSRVLKDASDFEAQGLDNYGSVVLDPYSIEFSADGASAVIQDCQDQTGFGSLYVATGKKRTVGIAGNHAQAGLVRGPDGVWRVQTLQYVENVPC